MSTVSVSINVPSNIGDYSKTLERLRFRKQRALYSAIKDKQSTDELGEELQIRFGSRRINVKDSGQTARLIDQFGTKVFGQRWIAMGTSRPPLDRVVNEIMGSILAIAPRWPGDKSRTARYRDQFKVYRRQSGEKALRHSTYPVGPAGWDGDTMFVIANLISYASSLEAQYFDERGTGIMYHAAKLAAKKYPFVGVRFRYYQENRFPPGDYGRANADMRAIRYYSLPVIEIGRASLVRKPSTRPGVRSRLSRRALVGRQRSSARRNLRQARFS